MKSEQEIKDLLAELELEHKKYCAHLEKAVLDEDFDAVFDMKKGLSVQIGVLKWVLGMQ